MVDNRVGYVTRITSRYVVLKSADGSEASVPNDRADFQYRDQPVLLGQGHVD
jgi:hypothetical protein